MNELVFDVTQEADGGLLAERLTDAIFTQTDCKVDLRFAGREAMAQWNDRQGCIRP